MGSTPSVSSSHLRRSSSVSNNFHLVIDSPTRHLPGNTSLRLSSFRALWSRFLPETKSYPPARTGHFTAYVPELNAVLVGCGDGADSRPRNDIWLLDLPALEWHPFPVVGNQISPRAGCRAVAHNSVLWVFGGIADGTFYGDLYSIDLNSKECRKIETTGVKPSPRRSPVFLHWGEQLFLWGGYDGNWPNELYTLDLRTFEWGCYRQTVAGRNGTTYTSVSKYGVCYTHQSMGGLIIIDFESKSVAQLRSQGTEPDQHIVSAGMVAVGRHLFLVGGKGERDSEYALMYSCELRRDPPPVWSVVAVQPDGETVTKIDGLTDGDGLFQTQRISSIGIVFDPRTRRIITVLGRPMRDPTPIHVFNIGGSLGVVNLQSDLLKSLSCDIDTHPPMVFV